VEKIIEQEFRLSPGLIHLNHAAVSPWPLRTSLAVQAFAEENMRDGSMHYSAWLKAEDELRSMAAELLNAPSKEDIALLKNTSEALSVVAYGLPWEKGDNIVTTDQEFPSNRIVWQSLSEMGVALREACVSGPDSPEDSLFKLVDDRTRLITVSSVQFSSGLRLDLDRIGRFCREHSICFCVDAIQSLGALRMDVQKIGADFVMADGHKWMLGPEGLAIFYCSARMRENLKLNQFGWHMTEDPMDFDKKQWRVAGSARRFECGSPNMLGIHALRASISLLLETGMEVVERELIARTKFIMEKVRSVPELQIITPSEDGRYGGIVTLFHRDRDNKSLYDCLISHNILCALRGGGIRLSPHFYTPFEQIATVLDLILRD
jgi:selenocysteine lyase/cysteine desulfurase